MARVRGQGGVSAQVVCLIGSMEWGPLASHILGFSGEMDVDELSSQKQTHHLSDAQMPTIRRQPDRSETQNRSF